MPMTPEEAKAKLKDIAGQYHEVRLKITENDYGVIEQICTIYINGEDFYHGETFEEAFAAREKVLVNKTIAAQIGI